MISFKEFFSRKLFFESSGGLLFEHEIYKIIPGTKNSYRRDAGNTSTLTQQHCHIYAKPKGGGKELYSVNFDGSGHDGSSGIEISSSHAEFLRDQGFKIALNNILECVSSLDLDPKSYSLLILDECRVMTENGSP